ncbi:hypothetical protein [Humidesulfovibrio idahonensis]
MTRPSSFRIFAPALILLLSAFSLAGCWVPETYIGRIKIERDGSYKLYLEGTAADPDAMHAMRGVAAESKSGKLKPEDVKKRQAEALEPMLKDIAKLKAEGKVETANSIGDGRVRFSLLGKWRMNRDRLISSELGEPLTYAIAQDGTVRVRVKDAAPVHETASLGLHLDGDLSIILAEGIVVLEHNAQTAPKTPNGAYRWHIDGHTAQVPFMRLRFPSGAPEPQSSQAQKKLAHH